LQKGGETGKEKQAPLKPVNETGIERKPDSQILEIPWEGQTNQDIIWRWPRVEAKKSRLGQKKDKETSDKKRVRRNRTVRGLEEGGRSLKKPHSIFHPV